MSTLDAPATHLRENPFELAQQQLRLVGETFDIDVNGEFIRDANGTPVQMIFVVRDVTVRRQAEEAMATTLKEKLHAG